MSSEKGRVITRFGEASRTTLLFVAEHAPVRPNVIVSSLAEEYRERTVFKALSFLSVHKWVERVSIPEHSMELPSLHINYQPTAEGWHKILADLANIANPAADVTRESFPRLIPRLQEFIVGPERSN